jgi:hypothetical protein
MSSEQQSNSSSSLNIAGLSSSDRRPSIAERATAVLEAKLTGLGLDGRLSAARKGSGVFGSSSSLGGTLGLVKESPTTATFPSNVNPDEVYSMNSNDYELKQVIGIVTGCFIFE